MSNFLVLEGNIYHQMVAEARRLDEQFRTGSSGKPIAILPSRVLMMLNVVAVIGDDFNTFKEEYLK